MKFQSLIRFALALAASSLLAACGGGGAASSTVTGGPFQLSPAVATWFAGVPATLNVQGGHGPYTLTSTQPTILPVPSTLNSNSFDVVPANPGVVDVGLGPTDLQVSTVTIVARDQTGSTATAVIKVAQNFLTGYGLVFGQSTGCTGAGLGPCAGGDTEVHFNATFNGVLHGNQPFVLSVVRGQFSFFNPISSTTTITQSITVNSDHNGVVSAIIRVPAGVPTQLAVIRITEPVTGASSEQVFTISGLITAQTLVAIPASVTFTGRLTTDCGTGASDVFIFDGTPPYTAISSNPNVTVTPVAPNSQPGRFTITVSGSTCFSNAPVIFQDSHGNRVTVSVTSAPGTTPVTPPPPPATFSVAPNNITLTCGTTGSVTVVGGTPPYSASSSSPAVTASVSGNTVSITRLTGDATVYPNPSTVTVTDGTNVGSVQVTTQFPPPATNKCP